MSTLSTEILDKIATTEKILDGRPLSDIDAVIETMGPLSEAVSDAADRNPEQSVRVTFGSARGAVLAISTSAGALLVYRRDREIAEVRNRLDREAAVWSRAPLWRVVCVRVLEVIASRLDGCSARLREGVKS